MNMKAVHIADDKSLHLQDTETPVPGPGEVLIKIHATAISKTDIFQRWRGDPRPPGASPFLGLECAGVVDALGDSVSNVAVGDRICALLDGGGYAEYVTAPAGNVVPLPQGYSFVHGAALPEVFATAWLNLFMEAGLQAGEKVILHQGAGAVAMAAIQLCKSFGSPCFVTVGSDAKIDTCIELGADDGANRFTEAFLEKATDFVGKSGAGVILDPLGGVNLDDNLQLLGLNGRLVLTGLRGGATTQINLAQLIMKRARVIGSTLHDRPNAEKAEVMSQLVRRVWPKIEAGEIRPIVDSTFPITEIEEAYALVEADKTIGKVVLNVRD